MGPASALDGLGGAREPDERNGFPDFGDYGGPSGPNINTLLGGASPDTPPSAGLRATYTSMGTYPVTVETHPHKG